MYGAILGDIVGSSREWRSIKNEDFDLLVSKSRITDDTVMTVATADAILNEKDYGKCYFEWGNKYLNAGYGGGFAKWLRSEDPQPYNSFGNGSAMRVSPVGWAYLTLEETLEQAAKSAAPTHNHPEGIKGAQAIAGAIYLARHGCSKKNIYSWIENEFNYNLNRKLSEFRMNYKFDVTCQGSVPEAIICFIEGNSYEDVIRKAVSLGGDADTQACIAGSIAEAYYGIPEDLLSKTNEYLPDCMAEVLTSFEKRFM